jgi:hypothetical protein
MSRRNIFPRKRLGVGKRSFKASGRQSLTTLIERLEDRTLLTVNVLGTPNWFEQGPGPITNGNNVIGIPNQPQAGATNSVAIDPNNPNHALAATIDGGIWRTTDFEDASPFWTPLTDNFPSLAIGDIKFSPLDATGNTLYAGLGNISNDLGDSNPVAGVLKTTDGGNHWTQLGQTILNGLTIQEIIPTTLISPGGGQVVLAATRNNAGLFRSADSGVTWTQISGTGGLPTGATNSLVADSANPMRFYVALPAQFSNGVVTRNGGVFRSDDGGVTWTNVSTGIAGINGAIEVKLAVHNSAGNNVVYAATLDATFDAMGNVQTTPFQGVSRSTNQGGTWALVGGALPNTNPGAQARNFSLVADPVDPNISFVSGDRGTMNNAGDVFRVNAGGGGSYTSVANGGANNTAPHPDSRSMTFDTTGANRVLVLSNDGGIYRLAFPNGGGATAWNYAGGDIRPTEFFAVAYDSINGVIFGGAQDNSTPEQNSPSNFTWKDNTGGDGEEVGVDNTSNPNHSIRYTNDQNLGNFTKETYDNTNTLVNTTHPGLVVNGTGGQNIAQVEANAVTGGQPPFFTPWVLNAADPTRIMFGTNFLYESTDQGNTVTALGGVTNLGGGQFKPSVSVGAVSPFVGSDPIAYGGFSGGVANTAVLWVGAGGQLRLRTSGTGVPSVVGNYTGAAVVAIVMDPTDWHTAYILDQNGQVFKAVSNDAGTTVTFTNVTGNLPADPATYRSIEFVRSGTTQVLLVGGQQIYRSINPGPGGNWTVFGAGLPNANVRDLHYIPPNGNPSKGDILLAGTDGRGAWTINNAAAMLVNPLSNEVLICGDENNPDQNDAFRLVRDPVFPTSLDVYVNGVLESVVPLAGIQNINIYGGGGVNTLTVDSSNGLINVPNGITFNAGDPCPTSTNNEIASQMGEDGTGTLILTQTAGPTISSDVYSPGPNPGQGHSVITDSAGNTQSIYFTELAPVLDNVPAASATINGTPAANAINYVQGPGGGIFVGNTGLVTIDNLESYEFNNKTQLFINAAAGSDEINLNDPAVPAGMSTSAATPGINVSGQEPTASDTVIVNGTSAANAINFSPTAADAANVTGAGPVAISLATIEHVTINGQGGNDTLTVTLPTAAVGNGAIYTPGATPDSGSIDLRSLGVSGIPLLSLNFTNIGATGSVAFANAGGRTDFLDLNGTSAADRFSVASSGDVQVLDPSGVTLRTVVIHTPGIKNLSLRGVGDSDTFNVTGPLPFTGLTIDADATVNLSGASAPVTVNLGDNTPGSPNPNTVINGYGAPVTLIGVDVANLDANNHTVTAIGTSLNDNILYTPTGATAGTFYDSLPAGNNQVPNTVFNFSGASAGSVFTVFGGAGGNSDAVTIQGTDARDLTEINQGPAIATVLANNVTSLLPVQLATNVPILNADGLGGQNTFQVIPAPGLGGGRDNLLININGGTTGAFNALVLGNSFGATPGVLAANQFVVVNRNLTPNSGTVRVFTAAAPNPDINYQNIQVVSPNVNSTAGLPNLLQLGPDIFEANETRFGAYFLGSAATVQAQNASIFPSTTEFPGVPADQDFYRVVAQNTGTLDFQVYFQLFSSALLPAGGVLNVQVLDVNGIVIASGVPSVFGSVGSTANARIRIPAIQGQTYFLRVFGASVDGVANGNVVNGYNMTVINTPVAAPATVELSHSTPNGEQNDPLVTQGTPGSGDLPPNAPPSDSGRSQLDNVTNGGFDSTAHAAAAAAAGTAGKLPAPAGSTLAKPTIYLRLDDAFLLQDLPGNQTPGGVPGTSPIPINFNSSTSLTPTFVNAPINGVAFNGNFRIAVYDGGNGAMSQQPGTNVNPSTAHTLDPSDGTFIGFAQPVPAINAATGLPIPGQFVPHLYMLTIGSQGGPTGSGTGALASDTLDEGIHNITARVQIVEPSNSTNPVKTGFGQRSDALQITIDTVAPPAQFGFGANQHNPLTPDSDTGVVTEPETSSDKVTSDTSPTFQGMAEANSIVRVYDDINNNHVVDAADVFLGETVAIPLDGTNAFPNGQWSVHSVVDLNDPKFFPTKDGIRNIIATAEDLAGNMSSPPAQVQIFIDTQGPQITGVFISDPTDASLDGENTGFNLFGEKFGINSQQADQGPTPLVYAITINVQDLPPRFAPFLDEIAFKPELVEGDMHADGGITLIGDANGRIAFQVFVNLDTPTPAGQPATGEIQLRFVDANGNPVALPDDRYTLHIDDSIIVDPAGNKLDGESNASEPLNNPTFPTGNGAPGGDFTARFTVDSRPEIGDYASARVNVDINGNFLFDPQNPDFTNRDLQFTLQQSPSLVGVVSQMGIHDGVFAGNFPQVREIDEGPLEFANGFDKLGAYGFDPVLKKFRWLIDTDGDGVADIGNVSPLQVNGIAITGDFDPSLPGDELALFTGTQLFFFDVNAVSGVVEADPNAAGPVGTNLRGIPIVGDFNGDGTTDVATWLNDRFQFDYGIPGAPFTFFDTNAGNPAVPLSVTLPTITFGFPGVGEIPVAADMDQDGFTDVGLWVPGRSGTVPEASSEWFFLMSNDLPNLPGQQPFDPDSLPAFSDFSLPPDLLNHPFSPAPLGADLYAQYGDEFGTPIVANFDPPLAPASAALASDTTAPTSSITALPTTTTSRSVALAWSGQDNAGGSGIATYDVYVSDNGGRYQPFMTGTTATSALFPGVNGHTYSFFSMASDNAGNRQSAPSAAQATTKLQVHVLTSTALATSRPTIVPGQPVTFTATVLSAGVGNGTPTGHVTFKDGTTVLATVSLSGGVATYTTSKLSLRSHTITASYTGGDGSVASTSKSLTQRVVRAALESDPIVAGATALYVGGTSASDTIAFSAASATGAIKATLRTAAGSTVFLGTFNPTGHIVVYGIAGSDTIYLSSSLINGKRYSISLPGIFFGDATHSRVLSDGVVDHLFAGAGGGWYWNS